MKQSIIHVFLEQLTNRLNLGLIQKMFQEIDSVSDYIIVLVFKFWDTCIYFIGNRV